jgi:hypothetical protein
MIVKSLDSFTGLSLHLDATSVDDDLSFHLVADFSVGSNQPDPELANTESDAGEI